MEHNRHDRLKGEINRADVNALWNASQSAQDASHSTIAADPISLDAPAPIVVPEPIVGEIAPIIPRVKHLTAGRPRGRKSNPSKAARRVSLRLITDPVYQSKLRERLLDGTLSPAIESLLWAYAYGRPVAKHEVESNNSLIISVQRPW